MCMFSPKTQLPANTFKYILWKTFFLANKHVHLLIVSVLIHQLQKVATTIGHWLLGPPLMQFLLAVLEQVQWGALESTGNTFRVYYYNQVIFQNLTTRVSGAYLKIVLA